MAQESLPHVSPQHASKFSESGSLPIPAGRSLDTYFRSAAERGIRWWRESAAAIECRSILYLATPFVMVNLAYVGLAVTDMMFVGRLGTEYLAAAQLAWSFAWATGYIALGLIYGMDTLVSQAFGAGNLRLVCTILQNAFVVLTIAYIPVCILWWNGAFFLSLLGQDPATCALAGNFLRYFLPGFLPFLYYRALLRFLCNQAIVTPTIVIGIVSLLLNVNLRTVLLNYLFIFALDLGLIGSAIATSVSRFCMPCMLWYFVRHQYKGNVEIPAEDISHLPDVSANAPFVGSDPDSHVLELESYDPPLPTIIPKETGGNAALDALQVRVSVELQRREHRKSLGERVPRRNLTKQPSQETLLEKPSAPSLSSSRSCNYVKPSSLQQVSRSSISLVRSSVAGVSSPPFIWYGWSREAYSLRRLHLFMRYGAPAGIMMFLEVCGNQIPTMLSGLFPDSGLQLAATSIAYNITEISYVFPLAICIGCSSRVGQLLGAGDPAGAHRAAKVGIALTVAQMCVNATAILSVRHFWPTFYTDDPATAARTSTLMLFSALFCVMDGLQSVCGGILRGVGQPARASFITFFGLYVVALPLSYMLGFSLGFESEGVWAGICSGMGSIFIGFLVCILVVKWKEESVAAQKRAEAEPTLSDLPAGAE